MIDKARQYKAAGDYSNAFFAADAAMRYSGISSTDKYEAEALKQEIFLKINQLRDEAEKAKKEAIEAAEEAKRLAGVADKERGIAQRAKIEAYIQRDRAERARDTLAILAQKGKELEQTFSSGSAYDTLYQRGLRHFAFNTLEQSRDYENALTYFALARFLKPSDPLRYLVDASQIGIKAEADFLAGNLDSAEFRYKLIILKADSAKHEHGFEEDRIKQIEEVRGKYKAFTQRRGEKDTGPAVLVGNWWTLPHEFGAYQNIEDLTFRDNPSNFKKFPTVLGKFQQLKSLSFINCPNARHLTDWKRLIHLKSLTLRENANLYAIEKLGKDSLSSLSIDGCPALTLIQGCENLTQLSIQRSPQARVSKLLEKNRYLSKLELADLTEGSLNIDSLKVLQSLSLARMKASNLQGLKDIGQLQELKIDELDNLGTFEPPGKVSAVYISHCHALDSLNHWPASVSLTKLVLFENNGLKTVPNWRLFPNLNTLLIQSNQSLTRIPRTRALKNLDRAYLLNNPKLRTNSLQVGFGLDWDVRVSSLKIEFEHRRRMQLKMFKNQDFGLKGVASYIWKNFYTPSPSVVKHNTEGWVLGGVLTYYSPYLIYTGLGIGYANLYSLFTDQSGQRTQHFVWINTIGVQLAPRLWRRNLLRKDKLSLNMDLYTISNDDKFISRDYFIHPSFGLTYHITLDLHKNTNFLRINESRKHTFFKGKKVRVENLPDEIWGGD
ncbi:MAG: hypothetical protein ACKVUS_08985 [Saprospiraceae bacterium]